jgi:hypothetical protein
MRTLSLTSMGAALVGLSACGLLSSDITKVTFTLPSKTVAFDTASLNSPAGNTVAVPCGQGQIVMDCCNPPAGLPKPDCNDTMNITCPPNAQGTSVCTAEVTVFQSTTLNLGQEVPQLGSATSLANLSISQITDSVDSNSMNVDLPPAIIYLAPTDVTDPRKDTRAKQFGTVPVIPAGTTPTGNVSLEPDATTTFSSFTRDLKTPFNLIVLTTVDVASGSPIPSGAVQITVTGKMSASL